MTSPSSTALTLQQQRADHALKKVKNVQSLGPKMHSDYLSRVNSLPATIVMNGLGQALTMLLAKAEGKTDHAHRHLFDHVATWLQSQITELNTDPTDGLIQRLMENDQQVYLRAQVEAMSYLTWLKQFARAYLNEAKS